MRFSNALPVGEQYLYLVNHSTMIAQRREGSELLVNLFRADNWYIEVYFHRSTDQLGAVWAFDAVRLLEPYLDCFYLAACWILPHPARDDGPFIAATIRWRSIGPINR
jgi:hypothetical protein